MDTGGHLPQAPRQRGAIPPKKVPPPPVSALVEPPKDKEQRGTVGLWGCHCSQCRLLLFWWLCCLIITSIRSRMAGSQGHCHHQPFLLESQKWHHNLVMSWHHLPRERCLQRQLCLYAYCITCLQNSRSVKRMSKSNSKICGVCRSFGFLQFNAVFFSPCVTKAHVSMDKTAPKPSWCHPWVCGFGFCRVLFIRTCGGKAPHKKNLDATVWKIAPIAFGCLFGLVGVWLFYQCIVISNVEWGGKVAVNRRSRQVWQTRQTLHLVQRSGIKAKHRSSEGFLFHQFCSRSRTRAQ